ncbi:patatin-like phospholipase family protein [Marivirga harenae]|uniref:patatin-like phospholipase family protein n=1 Tax=Marivirga harenae TaxID=2010992 RepID=UPI0026E09E5B|nr:patatin-like phospholipase family protein [Marivirga harenae]WKV13460.1 patatin-like phospholipase family protein [Marivirga harenae]|tara:strand:+ start:75446 stop:76360 length:915 start_codon:yes stop_codon:yes gene_type:complete
MKQKVALVLGSGGARGVAHIGVIEALEENGFEISSISGSSMGAVIGGLYAAGKMQEYKDWVTHFDKIDVFKLLDFTLSFQGIVRGEKVFKEMRKLLGEFKIEDFPIPFTAVASNIRTQREILFSEGNLMDALRASCAIPTVLTPVYQDNEEIVDGGVLNPIPLNRVKRTQGDILIAVDVNAAIPFEKKVAVTAEEVKQDEKNKQFLEEFATRIKKYWPMNNGKEVSSTPKKLGYFDLLNRSIDLMQEKMTNLQMEIIKPDMLVQISRNSCGTFEFYRSNELVEIGKTAFEKSYRQYNNGLETTE